MPRRFTAEILMDDNGNVNITTINEGDFNLMEKYGIIEFIKTAITNEHNRRVEDATKKDKKKSK